MRSHRESHLIVSRTHGWTRANLQGRGDRGVVRHAGVELQFVIDGEYGKLQAGKHADLAEDRGHVMLDGVLGDRQVLSEDLVRVAAAHGVDNLELAWRQPESPCC